MEVPHRGRPAIGAEASEPRVLQGRLAGRRLLRVRRRDRDWLGVEGRFPGPIRVLAGDGAMWLGDPWFDRRARVEGDRARARAALSFPVRTSILRLLAIGAREVRWTGARLVVVTPRAPRTETAPPLELVAELARRLERKLDLDEGLLAVALEDPEVRVRAAAAEILLVRARQLDETRLARFAAALAASPRVRPRLRRDAVWTLASFAPEGAGPVLLGLLGVEIPSLRRRVIEQLTALRHAEAADALVAHAASPEPRVAVAALDALGALGERRHERAVRARLESGPSAVRVAAARALARLGGPAGAGALARVAKDRSTPIAVRNAAREALARLKAHLPPPGALALPELREEGSVSLTLDLSGPLPGTARLAGVSGARRSCSRAGSSPGGERW